MSALAVDAHDAAGGLDLEGRLRSDTLRHARTTDLTGSSQG
jgi:hypothetical protein